MVEGERYKKSPGHSHSYYESRTEFTSPAKYAVFKRIDILAEDETPSVGIFLVRPDALSGLFNLANYDWHGNDAVIIPWGSGCSSIIADPYQQSLRPVNEQQGIIGMFDGAARPFVDPNKLSFAVPWERLKVMTANMDESFLSDKHWHSLIKRS